MEENGKNTVSATGRDRAKVAAYMRKFTFYDITYDNRKKKKNIQFGNLYVTTKAAGPPSDSTKRTRSLSNSCLSIPDLSLAENSPNPQFHFCVSIMR